MFLTTVSQGQQVTWVVYDTGALTIPEGQRVDWGDTLCGQLAADGLTTCSAVGLAYPGNRAAAGLGIETFVSLPIRGVDGEVVGTLCGACADRREVPAPVLGLMGLFADALSGQLTSLTLIAGEAS